MTLSTLIFQLFLLSWVELISQISIARTYEASIQMRDSMTSLSKEELTTAHNVAMAVSKALTALQ